MPAPSATNLIDRVDSADRPIGLVPRAQVFATNAGFRVVHVLVRNDAGELLLQQLSASRERSPGRWGSSVAGYLLAGETYLEAAERRLNEEIGLTVPLSRLGGLRMEDQGATKFIELFECHAESASIRLPDAIAALRFWTTSEIERTLNQFPSAFTETFARVYELYRLSTQ
jgi:isopentenyl-diphosphate delta-isomerase